MWQHSGDVIMMTSLQLSVSTFQSEIALHQAGALQLVTCDPCEAPTRHGTDWDNCFLFIRYMIRAGCYNLPRELSLTASSQSARDKFPENFSATLLTSPSLPRCPKHSRVRRCPTREIIEEIRSTPLITITVVLCFMNLLNLKLFYCNSYIKLKSQFFAELNSIE